MPSLKSLSFLAWLLVASCFLFTGCNYDVSLTAKPTHRIEPRLLGDWVTVDQDNQKQEFMNVRQWDDSTYVVAFDHDLYRAFHSDFAGSAFLSVQDLNSPDRHYLYLTAELSADGQELSLRTVSTQVISEKTKGRSALQALIKQNLKNPGLFGEPLLFSKSTARNR